MLVQDLRLRVLDAATSEFLRDLALDPTKRYRPPDDHPDHHPGKETPEPTNRGFRSFRCPETSHDRDGRFDSEQCRQYMQFYRLPSHAV
jgi:hypothetical protein